MKTPNISATDKDSGTLKMSYSFGALEVPKVKWDDTLNNASIQCKSWGYQEAQQNGGPAQDCIRSDQYGNCNSWKVDTNYSCKMSPEQEKVAIEKKRQARIAQEKADAQARKDRDEENAKREASRKAFFNKLSEFKIVVACHERYPGSRSAENYIKYLMDSYASKNSIGYANQMENFKCSPFSETVRKAVIEQNISSGKARLLFYTDTEAYYILNFTLMEDGVETSMGVVAR